MTQTKFIYQPTETTINNGSVSYKSPSNIALVKYWGKYDEQLPQNTSISFTLSNCNTQTTLYFEHKAKSIDNNPFSFKVYLDGKREPNFEPKIKTFFERVAPYVSFIKDFDFKIETSNSFPHSSGIASSASGMSALALCLMDLEKQLAPTMQDTYFYEKASFLARLGSGSACRSIEGPLVVWGQHEAIENSSQYVGTAYPYDIHSVFKSYQDTILLADKGEKQVSSTLGHNLMHNHPFAKQRFEQANTNISQLIPILKEGNLDAFIALVESEALSLHAMMMTSMPYFILMKPNTLKIIEHIWEYRKSTQSKLCFTLDAGANVHLLYPEAEKNEILTFINTSLVAYCQNANYICDTVGKGAEKL